MKKILTKEQQEKKRQRNQLIIGGIMILIMVMSTAGYALVNNESTSGTSAKYKYKGTNFVKDSNGYWDFTYNSVSYIVLYNPDEVKDYSVLSKVNIDTYKSKPLYFVTDGNSGNTEITRNFYQRIPSRIQNACLSQTNCTNTNLPVKDCNGNDNVIVIREPNPNENERVYQDNKCVYIIASNLNESKVSDAFLYSAIGI